MTARLRCAMYTRKSTEEGLEQAFNSLDAQRESCEAYILSQAGEGWVCLPELYDDGGWSGGNMDRPAIKRLLEDIAKGRIDVVVVYKVDRLTRSLMDFARIVDVFDANKVSFVSVIQAFNTTSSMGRLTLNKLLSFAQVEREVTGERIRDKIAASKARGIWMGGNFPLGYDLGDRMLIINPEEADVVRHLYRRYLELKSLPKLAKDLSRAGIHTKRWVSRAGKTHGGTPFNCSGLSHILNNRIYLGEVVHWGKAYAGEHEAIIDTALFKSVKEQLSANHHRHTTRKTRAAACPLKCKIFDADGQPMRPSFSYGRGKKMYRYYVSDCLLPNGQIGNTDNLKGTRLPAVKIERALAQQLILLVPDPGRPDAMFDAVSKVVASHKQMRVSIDVSILTTETFDADMVLDRARQQIDPDARLEASTLTISIEIPAGRKGRTVAPGVARRSSSDARSLTDLIRVAHRKLAECDASPLQPERHKHMTAPLDARSRQRLAIGLLAPAIQKAILQGTVDVGVDPEILLASGLPLDWSEQRRAFGLAVV
jgi:site-specific DNA recombinase